MNLVTGIICFLKKEKYYLVDVTELTTFNIKLVANHSWLIGLDQSTSCIGFSMMDTNNEFLIQLDLYRDKRIPKEQFYREVKAFLKRIVKGQKINLIVIEKPVPSKYVTAGNILRELKGHVEEWIYDIPELECAEFQSIYPQSWKTFVVDKNKGKNRHKEKALVASDLVEIFPLLKQYYIRYPFNDYDSFDATGLLYGYLQYAYDSDGYPKICGTIEKTHISLVCYKWIDTKDLSLDYAKKLFGESWDVLRPVYKSYNFKYSLHENIRMASSNNNAIFTVLPRSELMPFMWQYDIDINDKSKTMVMFVFRRGAFAASTIKFLKQFFEMYKEESSI